MPLQPPCGFMYSNGSWVELISNKPSRKKSKETIASTASRYDRPPFAGNKFIIMDDRQAVTISRRNDYKHKCLLSRSFFRCHFSHLEK